jgi:hypothetical protein
MVTAGFLAHACGEGGAVARGNVELLEVSDRVEHVVCAFPTPGVAPVSGERELDRRVEYGWEHSARVCRGSTGGGTARDFRSRLALGAAKLEHAPYLSDALSSTVLDRFFSGLVISGTPILKIVLFGFGTIYNDSFSLSAY